ncbi:host attachment protein [Marinobacter sp. TBZ242]|uniref:Host attachment protein n=1 Tax=Marinobacter azerbaijanicus TaxID=3050455 RepID=A0ABT7I9L5_9GAMM|nr:host attachment protein [Marinobacter sp. TBZ242]MDL0430482.1 host attachment protein [Marinobacter sp. TBZ242]
MADYCVIAAELAKARIFTLESSETPELERSPYLTERKTLSNPEHKAHESEIWSDTRRGANREHQGAQIAGQTTGIPHHNYDEHRDQREHRANRQFAKDIVADLKQVIREKNVSRLILCAESQMLGILRPELKALPTDEVTLTEVDRDLANLPPHELHFKLAEDGFLPREKRPSVGGP